MRFEATHDELVDDASGISPANIIQGPDFMLGRTLVSSSSVGYGPGKAPEIRGIIQGPDGSQELLFETH